MNQIHQILPNFSYGDAIGNDCIAIRNLLRKWGYDSHIYAHYVHPKLKNEYKFYTLYKDISFEKNILIYHFSIATEVSDFVIGLPDKKIMVYHNITPENFFDGINDNVKERCKKGRLELKRLAGHFNLALGVSEYNRQELESMGYHPTGILPILTNFNEFEIPSISRMIRKYSDESINIIHVGRIVPNKKIEDIIKTFYFFQKLNPHSRLFIIGTDVDMENYSSGLKNLASTLDIESKVIFTGSVTFQELVTYYRLSNLYLCMSEHEGFCVPLIESMHFGIPVIAFKAAGIPYTMGDSGMLIEKKDFPAIAALADVITKDSGLKGKIVASQKRRLENFNEQKIGESLGQYIEIVSTQGGRRL